MSDKNYKNKSYLKREYIYKGRAATDIAEDCNCGYQTIYNWLRKFDIECQKNKGPVELQLPRWLEWAYHRQEKSYNDIADELNCAAGSVERAMNRFDIERRGFGSPGEKHPNWKGGRDNYYGKNWNEQRQKVLRRDDFECRACGISQEKHIEKYNADLVVHHVVPKSEFESLEAANDIGNLVTTCKSCHHRYERFPVFPH